MQRADAAAILNISPTASSEEAVRAYRDLVTEYQSRLTNAPTPTLKNLYQARLRELEEAKEAFVGAAAGDGTSDLPTDQPSLAQPDVRGEPPAPPTPPKPPSTTTGQFKAQPTGPVVPPPPPPPRVEPRVPPAAEPLAPRKTNWALYGGIAAAVVVGALGYFLLGGGEQGPDSGGDTTAASTDTSYRTSVLTVLDQFEISRVLSNSGDYGGVMSALNEAGDSLRALSSRHPNDTAVTRMSRERDSLVRNATRACQAERRVALQTGLPAPACDF